MTTCQRAVLPFAATVIAAGLCASSSLGQQPTEAPPFVPPPLLTSEQGAEELPPVETPIEASILSDDSQPVEEIVAAVGAEASASSDDSARQVESLLKLVRANHPWFGFEPGAWRRVRVVTEAFDETGEVVGRTVTERRETLKVFKPDEFTLEIDSRGAVAGRLAPSPPELRRMSLLTGRRLEPSEIVVEPIETTSVQLAGVAAPCQAWRVTTSAPGRTDIETLHFTVDTPSILIRRDRRSKLGEMPEARRVQTVSRIGLPLTFGQQLVESRRVVTVSTHEDGARTEQSAVVSGAIPGGLYQTATTEYDSSGKRTLWSVMELVASGRSEEEIDSPLEEPDSATTTIEVRPRRFLRMLIRGERPAEEQP